MRLLDRLNALVDVSETSTSDYWTNITSQLEFLEKELTAAAFKGRYAYVLDREQFPVLWNKSMLFEYLDRNGLMVDDTGDGETLIIYWRS